MRVDIIAVGKLREKWLQKGAQEYKTRLLRHVKLSIIDVPDQPCPKAEAEQAIAVAKEGEQILAKVNPRSHIIALAVEGRTMDSPGLARYMEQLSLAGSSHITFIIGGSMGLSPEVLQRADLHLSFSKFTFPHQLMQVVLLEQIFRACKINAGETYHK